MTKAELVKQMATADGISKAQAEKTVDRFVSAVYPAPWQAAIKSFSLALGLSASVSGLNVRTQSPYRRKDQDSGRKNRQVQSD